MSKKFNKNIATVFVCDGHHRVMMPNGSVIPFDVSATTIDKIDQDAGKISTVTVTFLCNIAATEAEALESYNEGEN